MSSRGCFATHSSYSARRLSNSAFLVAKKSGGGFSSSGRASPVVAAAFLSLPIVIVLVNGLAAAGIVAAHAMRKVYVGGSVGEIRERVTRAWCCMRNSMQRQQSDSHKLLTPLSSCGTVCCVSVPDSDAQNLKPRDSEH